MRAPRPFPSVASSTLPAPLVARLCDDVRRRLFTPPRAGSPPRVGLEVELLVVDARTRHPLPMHGDGPRCGVALVHDAAQASGWAPVPGAYGAPRWRTSEGGVLSFEPGGQVEYSTRPFRSVAALLADVRRTMRALHESAASRGAELLAVGIDPENDVDDVPLQLDAERYRRMDAYFAALGGAGRRMMRQTAALQVNLDLGDDERERWARWRVLGRASPYLMAAFANARRHAGGDSGHASHRSWTWRELDPARTGVVPAGTSLEAAVDAYTRFALAAPWMLDPAVRAPSRAGDYVPFAVALSRGRAGEDAWREHLTTLFPEVRPKGYLEVRCLDMLPMARIALPVMVLAGLVYDPEALHEADALLPEWDDGLLRSAANSGMDDPMIASVARALVRIGREGWARLPADLRSDPHAHDPTSSEPVSAPRAMIGPRMIGPG